MSFWSRKKPETADPADLPLADRVGSLERKLRALDEDLDDLHDRFKRFQGRQAKRAALDATEPLTDPVPPGVDDASARILSLRQRTKVRPGGVR